MLSVEKYYGSAKVTEFEALPDAGKSMLVGILAASFPGPTIAEKDIGAKEEIIGTTATLSYSAGSGTSLMDCAIKMILENGEWKESTNPNEITSCTSKK